jgi:hypothetical protein
LKKAAKRERNFEEKINLEPTGEQVFDKIALIDRTPRVERIGMTSVPFYFNFNP